MRPDVVVTQDPDHSYSDLDPDRRLAMILYLESLALASRDFAREDGLAPHPVPTVYYMTPHHANCVVDITETFEVKQRALAELKAQHAFTTQVLGERVGEETLRRLLPADHAGATGEALGAALHRQMDLATHLYHGLLSHGARAALAEPLRREGPFTLDALVR